MKKVALVASAFFVVVLSLACLYFYAYFQVDAAYERLVSGKPRGRAEVRHLLSGFRERVIDSQAQMASVLRFKFRPGQTYVRYSRTLGMGIDVIYGRNGELLFLWPEYE